MNGLLGTSLLSPGSWPAFVLISTRLTGVMLVSPLWSSTTIPRTVRGAMVVVLAAVLVPTSPSVNFPDRVLDLPLPLFTELTIGAAIGLAGAVIVHALQLASEVVALQTGLSLGQVLTPNFESGGPALSQLYGLFGLAIFVAFGGHLMVIDGLAQSLQTIPPGGPIQLDRSTIFSLKVAGSVFANAIQIAAPVLAALTVTNIGMAILSKAVPQLNAMAMSFAVTIGVGLLMFGLSLPIIVRTVGRWTSGLPGEIGTLIGAFAPGR